SNSNLRAYVNYVPSGLVSISPTSDPSMHEDPFVNKVHGYEASSSTRMSVLRGSSFGFFATKSARIWPRIGVLDL
ncbi:hypothetical protein Tco_1528857, partial [Tanacetum coccineum]